MISGLLWLVSMIGTTAALAADFPTDSEVQANWPRFRGPGGNGVSAKSDAPVTCDIKTGANIEWIVEVPAEGYNSPVIWGNRVFLAGEKEKDGNVLCFDVATGKLQWKCLTYQFGPTPDLPEQTGLMASTMATDGQRLYVFLASGIMNAVSFEGERLWYKKFDASKNQYGHATSLLTWKDRVILQLDQGEADDKLSTLYCFDGKTGTTVWKQPRAVGASWATPIVIEAAGKPQVITLANPSVISYAAADGAELWHADCLDGEVTPSPVFAGGVLYVVSPGSKLQTIRPDGQGDVSATNLGWIAEDGIPDITSPVCNGELVFVCDSGGMVTCYDAKTGKKQWEQDLGEGCNASPSIAGSHLYLITKKGKLIVAEVARQYKELGRSDLGEDVYASPAFAQNKVFVRGSKHLICIGAAGKK